MRASLPQPIVVVPRSLRSPLVAVTATTEIIRGLPRVRVNEAYTDALESVGIVPLVLPPLDPGYAADALTRVDGLLLTGGEDVDPARYGEAPHPTVETHAARDAFELALVAAARDRALPTLAICRGLQVANVALGGSLVQDIPTSCPRALLHAPENARTLRTHEVSLTPGSRLARALGAGSIAVNSSHHQSIARLGAGLQIVARAPDGIVEGAEWTASPWWLVGVQWHPEELLAGDASWDRDLFAAFAAALMPNE